MLTLKTPKFPLLNEGSAVSPLTYATVPRTTDNRHVWKRQRFSCESQTIKTQKAKISKNPGRISYKFSCFFGTRGRSDQVTRSTLVIELTRVTKRTWRASHLILKTDFQTLIFFETAQSAMIPISVPS